MNKFAAALVNPDFGKSGKVPVRSPHIGRIPHYHRFPEAPELELSKRGIQVWRCLHCPQEHAGSAERTAPANIV